MNQIDQLISQAGIQGTFDVRCLYRGGFRLPHEQSPAGVMPFHLLMKGEIRVSTAQGDDVTLRPGDLLLLPGGEPHTIWREGDTLALAEPGDGLLPQRGDGGDQVEFLCGEYRYQGPLRPLLLDALPSPLCIPLLTSESQQSLRLVLSLIHQELQREQQGSGAVLTALSQVLLAMGLRAHASDPHGALGLVGALQDPRLGRSLQAMLADPANPVFTLRVGDAFAGLIGFKSADSTTLTIEIGYWLRSEYQGRGLMTAAAEALCRMAFGQMGMENVEIKCAAGNLRSNRIPLRLGFRLDRIEVRGEQLADGEFTDLNVYRLPRP